MAVFMINICKFNGCGITFPRLADLIEHIEDVHIDYDPAVVEQKEASQPACIPLSYVLKFFTEATRREFQNMPPVPEVRRRLLSAPKTPSVRSSTPTGSEMDEDELMSPSEDSNDSWTTVEEYSSEYILRYGVKMNTTASSGALGHAAQEKPFACPVPGCKKRYKNVNGIKYHSKNGHKKDGKRYPMLSTPETYHKKFMPVSKKRLSAQEYYWKKWINSMSLASAVLAYGGEDSEMTSSQQPHRHLSITGKVLRIKKAYKCQCGKSYKTAQGLKSHSTSQHVSNTSGTGVDAGVGAGVGSGASAGTMAGLVVTAAPHRPTLDAIDGNKLVRIYDTIKAKDLPTFTIPKHNLVNIVSAGRLPPARAPRVTVQPVPAPAPAPALTAIPSPYAGGDVTH